MARINPAPLRAGRHRLTWGHKTYLVGVINVSPDSFSGDGIDTPRRAIDLALEQMAEGADLIDVGGESTRPGASPVTAAEELRRVIPVVAALALRLGVPISVDTSKAVVAREALAAGAGLVNDVTGLRHDPALAAEVAAAQAGLVITANYRLRPRPALMGVIDPHSSATPDAPATPAPASDSAGSRDRAAAPFDVVQLARQLWGGSVAVAEAAGVPASQIMLDPGLGFGISPQHSIELLRRLAELSDLHHPLMVGPSRKGFIGAVLGGQPPSERLEGTLAAVAIAIAGGADAVRVHDVKAAHRVRLLADAVYRPRPS